MTIYPVNEFHQDPIKSQCYSIFTFFTIIYLQVPRSILCLHIIFASIKCVYTKHTGMFPYIPTKLTDLIYPWGFLAGPFLCRRSVYLTFVRQSPGAWDQVHLRWAMASVLGWGEDEKGVMEDESYTSPSWWFYLIGFASCENLLDLEYRNCY